MMARKLRWYLPRSNILTNKTEVKRIATKLRTQNNFKKVQIAPRTLTGDKRTKTPKTKGYWLKVSR